MQLAMDAARSAGAPADADEVVDSELADFIVKTHSQHAKAEASRSGFARCLAMLGKTSFGHLFKKRGQYSDPVIRLYLAEKRAYRKGRT
jgi:hypothetical protein